ncbi:MAG: hypothetical protein M3O15_16485 [Acidobacteriota bacterium]|nr:hypothetical protein [Acidobacteriota bacterium]
MTVHRRSRASHLLGTGLLLALPAAAAPAAPPPSPAATLRIVSDRVLPPSLAKAVDVRWASDRTVYLPLLKEGTVEAAVDPGGPPPREMVAGSQAAGGWSFNSRIGASPAYLVVAGPIFGLTWRTIDNPMRRDEVFSVIEDVDVAANRLLVIGTRKKGEEYAPDGAIAWIGSLDKGLADLRPVLTDATGPGAHNMLACANYEMGAARFLPGGSFIVVPGVQPGAYLYDANARLVRTWDTAGLGLDTDCASLTETQVQKQWVDFDARTVWLNRRRTLEEILPLPQGPGLVVRTVVEGRPHWQLKVLRGSGAVTSYDVPILPETSRSHLRGDVRGARIVFVLYTEEEDMRTRRRPPSRLIVALAPSP